jgi:N-acyl-L-homoserine lactone synthetase
MTKLRLAYDPTSFKHGDVEIGTTYRFKLLQRPEDLHHVFSRRFEIFCLEAKVADPALFPDGLETDEYDSRSLHLGLFEDGQIIAYGRFVMPCERYPIEKTNALPRCFERSTTLESSRAFVVKGRRRSDVVWHLFNEGYRFCAENGFEYILSFSNAAMFNGYRKRGVPFVYIGDAVDYHGHRSFPLVIRVEKGEKDFTKRVQRRGG